MLIVYMIQIGLNMLGKEFKNIVVGTGAINFHDKLGSIVDNTQIIPVEVYEEKSSLMTANLLKMEIHDLVMLNIPEIYFKVNRKDSLIFIQQKIKLRLNKVHPNVRYNNTQYSQLAQKAKKDGFFKYRSGDKI